VSDLFTYVPPDDEAQRSPLPPAYYVHVAEAPVRRAELLELITFEKDSGAPVRTSCCWPDTVRPKGAAA
jgi:hypothetical protein